MGNKMGKLNCLGHQNNVQKLEKEDPKPHDFEETPNVTETTNNTDVCCQRNNGDKTLAITDICYDCHEKIFEFLDLQSLLCVAQTCKQLQIAAINTFGNKFARKEIHLRLNIEHTNIFYIQSQDHNEYTTVYGLKNWAKFLRWFGAKILHLNIAFEFISACTLDQIDRYIHLYCADTLIEIVFNVRKKISGNFFQKQFKKIETVRFHSVRLENGLMSITKSFPNLRHLHLSYVHGVSSDTGVFFPHLEKFTLKTGYVNGEWTREEVVKFLHANRQLQSFDLSKEGLRLGDILNMIGKNLFISKLRVNCEYTDVNRHELNQFVRAYAATVILDLRCYLFAVDEAVAFVRQLNKLEKFVCRLKNRTECDRFLKKLNRKCRYTIQYIIHENREAYPSVYFYIKLIR